MVESAPFSAVHQFKNINDAVKLMNGIWQRSIFVYKILTAGNKIEPFFFIIFYWRPNLFRPGIFNKNHNRVQFQLTFPEKLHVIFRTYWNFISHKSTWPRVSILSIDIVNPSTHSHPQSPDQIKCQRQKKIIIKWMQYSIAIADISSKRITKNNVFEHWLIVKRKRLEKVAKTSVKFHGTQFVSNDQIHNWTTFRSKKEWAKKIHQHL